jgi:Tat protein secretion system quality control protein TatD with DNase activity
VTTTKIKNLIDGHAHLDAITPIDPVIERACSVGVSRIIAVGMDFESNKKTLEIAGNYPGLFFLPSVITHGPLRKMKSKIPLNLLKNT